MNRLKFDRHLDISGPGQSVTAVLAGATGFSKTAIKQIMKKGAVWLTTSKGTQRLRRADKSLPEGSTLHLYYDESVLQQHPARAQLIADEGDYSVWYKPYGMLSQGSKWGDHSTLYRYAEQNLSPQRSAFIVHRLDRAASGLVLLAHRKKTAAYFSHQFSKRAVEKVYQAKVEGEFLKALTIDNALDGKAAISHVSPLGFDAQKNHSLVSISIETGRKHQIRRHLCAAGYPIVGDRLYGNVATNHAENLALVACFLAFDAPHGGVRKAFELDRQYCPSFED